MVAIKQYGHFIYKQVQGGDSVQNEEGQWVPEPASWVFHSACREETNGKGTVIQGAGGQALVFSSLVLLPKGAVKIPEGTVVIVSETLDPEGPTRAKGAVLKCDISSMHGRLWV